MNKQEFLAKLRNLLSGLPQEEIEERLLFYSEMIDDRIEEGASESDAVSAVGDPEALAAQIISETPLSKLIKKKIQRKKEWKAWEIILIILGFPAWFPLLIGAFVILLSVYIVIWAVSGSLWSVPAALGGVGIGGVLSSVVFMCMKAFIPGLTNLGVGLTCAGLSIFAFFGCKKLTYLSAILSKKIFIGVKKLFIKKEVSA